MEQFKTAHETPFSLSLTFKDIKNVKKLVQDSSGKAVDLCEAMETGKLTALCNDLETFINVLFVLCLEQIQERFNVTKYDEANAAAYQMFPEQKDEPVLTKASRWFGGLFDGDSVSGAMEAFRHECVNFIPNGNRRQTMRLILEKEQEAEQMEAEYRRRTAEKIFQKMKEKLADNMEGLEQKELKNVTEMLDGLSG